MKIKTLIQPDKLKQIFSILLHRDNGTYSHTYRTTQLQEFFRLAVVQPVFLESTKGHRIAIAIDPCYISKSGKKTPSIDWFWSGCAAAMVERFIAMSGKSPNMRLNNTDFKELFIINELLSVSFP